MGIQSFFLGEKMRGVNENESEETYFSYNMVPRKHWLENDLMFY